MKKRFVVDVNVFFSALMSGKDLYINAFTSFQFLLPDFALSELQKYQSLILEKTKLSTNDLQAFTLALFEQITVVPNMLISNQSYLQAFELCKDIDEKDLTYVALAIEFDLPFITKDNVLVEGLKKKGFQNVKLLADFFNEIVI
jgi:predicted nucleic acid-binding protein